MLNIIYNASCWQTSYITGSIGRDFYGLIEFQAWVTDWLFSRPSPAKTLIKALTVNTAQIHWQSLSQITRQGGNGDEEVHLQTAEKPQRGGELSTTDIISHRDLLISHARHKHKQGDIHRCPAWWRTWRQRREVRLQTWQSGFSWHLQSDWLLTRLVWWTTTISAVCQQAVRSCGTWRWSLLQTDWVTRMAAVRCRDGKLQTNTKRLQTVQHVKYRRKLKTRTVTRPWTVIKSWEW